ncbi:MAG TPA: gamma-glutamyltransferase [Acidimicrobiales bacterium]|nr:gamma-glutamyltransferase [Acidimicrobiales bacterium]
MRNRGRWVLAALVVSLMLAGATAAGGQVATGPPTAVGSGGAVATIDRLATEAATAVLRRGGNAVDAAVTAAAVLGVVEPFSCGPGGGGFMVIRRAGDGRVTTIDHRETAPAAMRPDSFLESGQPLPFNDARFSGLSVGVPGTVAGWAEALESYGTMSLAQVLEPAIRIATGGFVIDQVFFDQIRQNLDYFDDLPATARLFLDPDGTPRDVGTVFRNPELARTYTLIARLGPAGFYRVIAPFIVDAVRRPLVFPSANHRWRPGVMTLADLARYVAPERAPTHVTYRGLDVYGMGPPSSGGSTVGEALNILEGYDLAALSTEEVWHLMLEASRYAFADRNAYIADPAFFPVPLRGLLSDGFAAQRRSLITDRAAPSPVPPGNPYPFEGSGSAPGQAADAATRSGSTTHISVTDGAGNAVSYTFTIESLGGNGMVVPGFGFLLNNELTDFTFTSTTDPNRVEGGKRPRSSMAPTIVLRDGAPLLVVGSPGGSMIITTVLQILVDRLDRGTPLPAAIAAPRASQRNTPATVAEPAFLLTPEAEALRRRGHVFTTTPEIGAANGIELLGGGRVLAAAEPVRRGGGSAMVESPGS